MRFVPVISPIFCLSHPAVSQVQHGSVGVVYYTKNKIVVAADSRVSSSGGGAIVPSNDNECKVVALDGDVVFVSTNMVRVLGSLLVPGWDNNSMIRAAYAKIRGVNSGVRGHLADVAEEWSAMAAANFNAMARFQPHIFRQMTSDVGDEAFTIAYIGGADGSGNLVLFGMDVIPNSFHTAAVGRVGPIPACSHHNFCAIGVTDIVVEFADTSSDRAKREAAEWKPPKGTPPIDYDAIKTMRMVELTIQHRTGNDVGGPVDAVQLNRDGSIRWYARKKNCPAS